MDRSKKDNSELFLGKNILMADIKQEPFLFVKLLASYMIHRIMLVDIKGLAEMCNEGLVDQLRATYSSSKEVL